MDVVERFNQLRIQLPKIYNDIDKNWIIQTLAKLEFNERQKAVIRYAEVYQEAYDSEEISYKKENAAGRAANTRLREYAFKCLAKRDEKVNKPPVLSAA